VFALDLFTCELAIVQVDTALVRSYNEPGSGDDEARGGSMEERAFVKSYRREQVMGNVHA